jgi:hypothetical protein
LFGATVDLGVAQSAERMIDDDRHQIGKAERLALHQGFVQEFGSDDDR